MASNIVNLDVSRTNEGLPNLASKYLPANDVPVLAV